MAISVVKRPLSGQADHGLWFNTSGGTVSATGTTIHTCDPQSTAAHDMVYIYANNTAAVAIPFKITWGTTANLMIFSIPATTYNHPVIEGLEVWGIGAASGTVLRAGHGAATQSSVQVFGHYVRYTES